MEQIPETFSFPLRKITPYIGNIVILENKVVVLGYGSDEYSSFYLTHLVSLDKKKEITFNMFRQYIYSKFIKGSENNCIGFDFSFCIHKVIRMCITDPFTYEKSVFNITCYKIGKDTYENELLKVQEKEITELKELLQTLNIKVIALEKSIKKEEQ